MGILNKDSASALIGGLGNLVGSLVGGKMSEDSSMKMAKYMNEYNKPANQIKRLKEAGINPALALSNSLDASVGIMDSSPKPADYSNIGNVGSTAVAAQNIAAQNKLLDAQRKGQELENAQKEAELPNIRESQQALQDLYIDVDKDGSVRYGDLDSDGNFVARYDEDSNLLPGLHKALYSQTGKELIGKGYLIDTSLYEKQRSKIEKDLQEKFGAQNARSIIRNLDAAAYEAHQTGKALQLDNDVFENISIGGKTAGFAVDGLKVLLSALKSLKK